NGLAHLTEQASLRLTQGLKNEVGAVWFHRPMGVQTFATEFIFHVSPHSHAADGFAFVLHNDPRGRAALGGSGPNLGYVGLRHSVAVFFRLFPNVNQVGQFVNGAQTDCVTLPADLSLHRGAVYRVSLRYCNGAIRLTITDVDDA